MVLLKDIKKSFTLLMLSVLIVGCTASRQQFPEAASNASFSMEAFQAGTFRLERAKGWDGGGECEASLYYHRKQELPPGKDLANAILDAVIADQSGSDAGYFWLGWVAERWGHYEAAYEYFRLSKLLFDYNRMAAEDENLWDRAWAASDEVTFSHCGYTFRVSRGQCGCVRDMREEIIRAITRLEREIASDL